MKNFEVDYETTLPPWHIGHEQIEAEDPTAVKEKFYSKHANHEVTFLKCFESIDRKKTISSHDGRT